MSEQVDEIYKAFAQAKAEGYDEPSGCLVPLTPDGMFDVDVVLRSLAERLPAADDEWLTEVGSSMRRQFS